MPRLGPAVERIPALKLLLGTVADADVREDVGTSPLGWAEYKGDTAMAELLAAAGAVA